MSPRVLPVAAEPETTEYQWVFANGHIQVSPNHTHEQLFQHTGMSEAYEGPTAMGTVEVQGGLAGWSVRGNVSLRYLSKLLQEYTRQVGWRWGGLIDDVDQVPIDDQFGPKRSRKTMHWFLDREGIKFAHKTSSIPSPEHIARYGSFEYDSKAIYIDHSEEFLALSDYEDRAGKAIKAFAHDTGREIKLSEYPGGGNILDKMKNEAPANEDYELENLGDNKGQDPRKPNDDDPGEGPWVTRDGKVFSDWGDYLIHAQELNSQTDSFDHQDGKFPEAPNMDLPIPNNWHPRQPFIMPLAHRTAAPKPKDQLKDPVPFIYDIDADKLAVGNPGSRHSDIPGKFTPGGIVEGTYEPGGKVIVHTMTNMPWTSRHVLDLWYYSYPQMEITSLWFEDRDGNLRKAG